MAVGDIINATIAGGTGTYNFTPAAGVEIIITYAGGSVAPFVTSVSRGGSQVGLTDGTNSSLFYHTYTNARDYYNNTTYNNYASVTTSGGNLKIGITNSFYLEMNVIGNASYSGIQIK